MTSLKAGIQAPGSGLRRWPLWIGFLSASLTAAFLDLSLSVLDHPRAFQDLSQVLAPLAVTVGACLAVYAVLVLVLGLPLKRMGLAAAPLGVGISAALVLAAGLRPVVSALAADAPPAHAALPWALGGGALFLGAAAAYLLTDRAYGTPATWHWGRTLTLAAPLGMLEVLAALWLLEYGPGTYGGARMLVLGGLGLVMVLTAALVHRLPAGARGRGLLAFLVLLSLAAPFLGRLIAEQTATTDEVPRVATPGLPPAVVLLTIDTLRPDFLEAVETPALDALAEDSVVFDNARSAAPWTKPSLATILTGLSPLVHGTTSRRVRLPEEVDTLAELLGEAGFHTSGMGFNVHLEEPFRFEQGFDEYAFPAREDYGSGIGALLLARFEPNLYPERFPSTEGICDAAVEWLDAEPLEPFFLWVHVLDPHWPYAPPAEHAPSEGPHPRFGNFWGDPATVTNVQAGNTKLGPEDKDWVRALYEAEIRYVDAEVGRILDKLREYGLYEESLIVLASDHGEEFWEHGSFEHGHTMYDEVLRVPLSFKLPGTAARTRIETPVSTEAIVPTVLEILDLPYDPARFSASSLAAHWGELPPEPEPLVGAGTYYHGEKYALFVDGRKLIHELDTDRIELYDLTADPEELHSLTAAASDEVLLLRNLLLARLQAAALLREVLGIEEESGVDLSDDALERMRAIGYGGSD